MTTIAANRELMAADSQATTGEGIKFACVKLFERQGGIIGFCGGLAVGTKFVRSFPDVEEWDEDCEFEALILNSKGIWLYESSLEPIKVDQSFYAIGSGAQAAIAAMHMGADPIQAVKIAAKIDSGTGGRVRYKRMGG